MCHPGGTRGRAGRGAITGGQWVGIGFGLREVLSTFVSGTVLLFERSLKPRDIVEVEGEMDTVDKVRFNVVELVFSDLELTFNHSLGQQTGARTAVDQVSNPRTSSGIPSGPVTQPTR